MKCNVDRTGRDQFERVARLYEEVRPSYPSRILSEIKSYAGVSKGSRVLEIGIGSGQATSLLLNEGFRVVGIEPGKNLAKIASKKFEGSPNLSIFNGYFEDFESTEKFDLITSATAFHWVDPDVAYSKSYDLLNAGGVLAPFWTLMPTIDEPVETMLREVFSEFVPEISGSTFGAPNDEILNAGQKELEETKLFTDLMFLRHEWRQVYDADSYTKLLDTYANFQALDNSVKDKVYTTIQSRLNRDFGGQITDYYLTALHMGRKSGQTTG
ncbi:MAG: class I SAM-dependent methyltransferase [Gammaproteobacteria bacterium]